MKTLILSAMLLSLLSPAAAQSPCGPPNEIMAYLQEKYGEQPVMTGEINEKVGLLVTASKTGTWTIIVVQGGIACIKASGTKATGPLLPLTDP